MQSSVKIPEPTLRRLPMYHRYLSMKKESGLKTISCTTIASELGQTPIQVRKDLQVAGAEGKPKVGYYISELIDTIGNTLGYNNLNDAFLIGVGNFGKLILNYDGFKSYGLNILAAFDNDKNVIGTKVNGVEIFPITKFRDLAERMKIKIGILSTNSDNAQLSAELMQVSGIEAIWNLTHKELQLEENTIVIDVNLESSLSILLSKLSNKYNK